MKYLFIVNPRAGSGVSRRYIQRMEKRFAGRLEKFEYLIPEDERQTEEEARRAAAEGVDRIAVVGGDGTLNRALNGILTCKNGVCKGPALVVADLGAGCDYYSSVARSGKPSSWVDVALDHEVGKVDVGRITFSPESGFQTRYFLNMAGAGMTADIVRRKEAGPSWIPSSLKYLLPTVRSLYTFEPSVFRISTDTEEIEVEALAVTVSKGRYAGAGMRFGLDVELDDGRFEITIFENIGPTRLATKLWRMYLGNYSHIKGVWKLWSSRVEIRSERPVPVEFDGELYGTTDLSIDLIPGAAYVCFPKKY